MIGKIFKFFFKFAFWSFMAGAITFLVIMAFAYSGCSNSKNNDDYGERHAVHETQYEYCYDEEMTHMVSSYNKIKAAPYNSWNTCPVCKKGYYKNHASIVCCSEYCENEYWSRVVAWNR